MSTEVEKKRRTQKRPGWVEKTVIVGVEEDILNRLAKEMGVGRVIAEKAFRAALLRMMEEVLPTFNLMATSKSDGGGAAVSFVEDDGGEHELLKPIVNGSTKLRTFGNVDEMRRDPVMTFGSKMVDLHLSTVLGEDRVISEIRQLGFDREYGMRPAIELACVVLHEISHAVVWLEGGRRRGVVHGPRFYQVYEALVRDRVEDVAMKIAERAGMPGLLDEHDRREGVLFTGEVHVGMLVEFSHGGRCVRGRAIRKGPKRWTVLDGIQKWHVPERLLRPVGVEAEAANGVDDEVRS